MAKQKAKNPQEYLIYVRVPRFEDDDPKKFARFLEHVANVLSDDDEHVYVESYDDYDGEKKARRKADKGDGERTPLDNGKGGGGTSNPSGGYRSTLQPMYVCHGKF
jgi:hypothetical protein